MGAIAQSGSRLYIAGGFARLGLATKPQLAALDAASGALDPQFVPPPRYPGRFEGHTGTRNDNPVTNGDATGAINSLLVTPGGQYLMVGGSFLHFGYDHTADPDHRHSGLIALDPATGALTVWQPDQGSNSSRPVFGMTAYPGDPRSIGVKAPVLIFTASGGAGGRVLAWVPGSRRRHGCGGEAWTATSCRWPQPGSGSTSSATSTTRCPIPAIPASRSGTWETATTA